MSVLYNYSQLLTFIILLCKYSQIVALYLNSLKINKFHSILFLLHFLTPSLDLAASRSPHLLVPIVLLSMVYFSRASFRSFITHPMIAIPLPLFSSLAYLFIISLSEFFDAISIGYLALSGDLLLRLFTAVWCTILYFYHFLRTFFRSFWIFFISVPQTIHPIFCTFCCEMHRF